jgi:hypothetical protein
VVPDIGDDPSLFPSLCDKFNQIIGGLESLKGFVVTFMYKTGQRWLHLDFPKQTTRPMN